nr:MAG TPA: hypothetical protein [Caudoviricetes sp.]
MSSPYISYLKYMRGDGMTFSVLINILPLFIFFVKYNFILFL